MSDKPLMPKATAVWLIDNTSLTFEQVAEFCGMHPLEVKGIADEDVAKGIKGIDPIASGQLTGDKTRLSDGPTFSFPDALVQPIDVAVVDSETLLEHNFRGWVPGEIAEGRAPVLAVFDHGRPVSICFCARRSDVAAAAGLETADAYRRRGYGAGVTAAWALAIRASGRVPLYSTAWTNLASLGVARKLNLVAYASTWSLYD